MSTCTEARQEVVFKIKTFHSYLVGPKGFRQLLPRELIF